MYTLPPTETQSSLPGGNFAINLLPAFSSAAFRGRNRQTTLMLHSDGFSFMVARRVQPFRIAKIQRTAAKPRTVMNSILLHDEAVQTSNHVRLVVCTLNVFPSRKEKSNLHFSYYFHKLLNSLR
ncbi:hypothetical protein X975_04724, partial [Stegodyphus mimosarum]